MSEMTTLVRCDCGAWRAARGSRHVCAGVPRSVAAMHAMQRNAEPPSAYGPGLAKRRAASGEDAAAPQVLRDGIPQPYATALAGRREAAGAACVGTAQHRRRTSKALVDCIGGPPMTTLDEVRARVERIVREVSEVRAARPHLGMIAEQLLRQQEAERQRVDDECSATISIESTLVTKLSARLQDGREARATSLSASDIMARRSVTAPKVEQPHWGVAADWLLGKVGGNEIPGGVLAMRAELGIERLRPVPNIDAELAELEADLAQHVEKLVSELDSWDREHAAVTGAPTR